MFVRYRVADEAVVDFFRSLRILAASRLAELDQITRQFFKDRDTLEPVDRKALLARARKGLVTVLVGGAAYAAAVFAAERGMGVLHWSPLPAWAAAGVTLLVLDFAVYLQHVMVHAVPVLWRLHRVHHADLGFDATTGLRFHSIETHFWVLAR